MVNVKVAELLSPRNVGLKQSPKTLSLIHGIKTDAECQVLIMSAVVDLSISLSKA